MTVHPSAAATAVVAPSANTAIEARHEGGEAKEVTAWPAPCVPHRALLEDMTDKWDEGRLPQPWTYVGVWAMPRREGKAVTRQAVTAVIAAFS